MSEQKHDHYNGHPIKVTVIQQHAGAWQSRVEVDLGKTGSVVFENTNQTYSSEAEARAAVLALVAKNLSRSRIGKANAVDLLPSYDLNDIPVADAPASLAPMRK